MWPWLVEGAGLLTQILLLFRGLRGGMFRRYYFFYTYITSAMLASLVMVWIILNSPGLYGKWYWLMQISTLVTGYGILLEIMNHVLAPYPGAERCARICGIVAFGVIFCFAVLAPVVTPRWSPGTVIEFERDLRSVQSLFICGLLALIFYYGIPIGKNMKGMVVGYGVYIVTSLMSLAVRAYAGPSFTSVWRVVQPVSLDVSLMIWLVALWSYCPNPVPDSNIPLEQDYEALVTKTRSVIVAIRDHFRKAARA